MAKDNESTMKWKVDISELKKGMQEAKHSISLANAEFKAATAGMSKWQNSASGVEAKIKQLKATLQGQTTVLQKLQKQYDLVSKEMGEDSEEAQRLKVQLVNQTAAINKTQAQLGTYNSKLSDLKKQEQAALSPMGQLNAKINEQESELADLKSAYANATLEFGKNSKEAKDLASQIDKLSTELAEDKSKLNEAEKAADEFDKSIDEAGKSAQDAADGGFTVMKGALANLVAQGISAALNAMRELSGAVLEMGKQSIASYAEYEQLVGGVDKLFGDSSDKLQSYAADAYRTSGMSANQYMQQATSFSAALINSLGGDTERAADLTDVAMRAMSDNVNTFGSNMQDVQNAFQGFAKQNYTMLDNLKLGYGGTKEEMARLIEDANAYAESMGMASDLSMDSFADIITAIELIQQKQNVAGTTAKEAASTIEGSLNMTKSAWENLLTGLANGDADVGALFDTFVQSAETYLGNLLPVVRTLMDQAIQLIDEKLREIAPEFMEFVDQVSAFLKDDLLPVLQDVFGWIIDNKDIIIAALTGILTGFLAFKAVMFIQSIPAMLAKLKTAIMGVNAVLAANPIGIVVAAIAALVAAFIYLWNTSDKFRAFWLNLWKKIKETASKAVESIKKFFTGAWSAIKNAWKAAGQFFSNLWAGIKKVFAPVVNFFKTLFGNAWIMVKNVWALATYFFSQIWEKIKAVFAPVVSFFKNIFTSAWNGIKAVWSAASGFFSGIWSSITGVFSNVSGWFQSKFSAAWSAIKGVFSGVGSFFGGIWNTIKGKFTDIGQKVGDAIGGAFKSAINAVLRTAENVLNAPINAINNLIGKINNVPGISLSKLNTFSLPRLATGAVLNSARAIIAGEDGAEAIVPLEKNKQWISKVASDMLDSLNANGGASFAAGGGINRQQVINFTQNNYSPKALDRLSIYRDTKSMFFSAKVGLANV